MDLMGVDIQAVSLAPAQHDLWADRELSAEIVEIANAAIAGLVQSCPERLVGIANVSLAHADLAVDQLERAVRHYGLRGVEISSHTGASELSDRSLDGFWSAAERLNVTVLVHPLGCSLGPRLARYFLHNTVGQPVEHAIALSHLIFSGLFDRFPGLRVCAAHGGGYLPYYIGRSDHAWRVRPESRGCLHEPSTYLRQIYFDSLVFRPDTLNSLLRLVGARRVVLGTDYPYDMGVWTPIERLRQLRDLDEDDFERIAGGNARELLGIAP
jgi:aminocarboxymuconate-semialdehyde decarboxylase